MENSILFKTWMLISIVIVVVFTALFFKSVRKILLNLDSDIKFQINNNKKLIIAYSLSKKSLLFSIGLIIFSSSLYTLVQFVLYSSNVYSDRKLCSQVIPHLYYANNCSVFLLLISVYSLLLIFIYGRWNNNKMYLIKWSSILFLCYVLFNFSISDLVNFAKTPVKDLPIEFYITFLGLSIVIVLTIFYIKLVIKPHDDLIENQEQI